jgi:hypothetical protein
LRFPDAFSSTFRRTAANKLNIQQSGKYNMHCCAFQTQHYHINSLPITFISFFSYHVWFQTKTFRQIC